MLQSLTSQAVIFNSPGNVSLENVSVISPGVTELVVEVSATGISTGTEKLLWDGTMPAFPGLKYPLVPGYEAVGTVVYAGAECQLSEGERVFVPGASCYRGDVRGLFGATSSQLVSAESRVCPLGELPDDQGVLLALAATAMHILTHKVALPDHEEIVKNPQALFEKLASEAPQLIVGHGTLGRLLARLCVAIGAQSPVVWEKDPSRQDQPSDGVYTVLTESHDERRDYTRVCDVSGSGAPLFDLLISRLARGGRLTLAGFYNGPVQFNFAPAFMREVSVTIAAEWQPHDMSLVMQLLKQGSLSLDGLVSHRESASRAKSAYKTAFEDKQCLKMMLDWSTL